VIGDAVAALGVAAAAGAACATATAADVAAAPGWDALGGDAASLGHPAHPAVHLNGISKHHHKNI